MPREGKFEGCIPGNHGNWGFPLTPRSRVAEVGNLLGTADNLTKLLESVLFQNFAKKCRNFKVGRVGRSGIV